MNETKKIVTLLIIAVVAIIGVIGINIVTSKENQKTVDKYKDMMNSKTEKLFYIGRPTCSYCQQLEPSLKEITGMYDIKYEYINIDDFNQTTLNKVLALFDTDTSTPQLFIVKKGKVINKLQGYTDRDGLFDFFKENEMIDKDEKLEAVDSNLNKLDYSKYDELINKNENNIIVVGQTGCSYCESAKPVLNALAKKYEMSINYLNITDLSEEDQGKVVNSLDIFSGDFGTPLIMVVNNKKVIDSIQGFESEEKYVNFFKKNNLIK